MARRHHCGDTSDVNGSSYSSAFEPILAVAAVGVLILLLRWAFTSGGSLVQRRVKPGPATDYGMLVAVASPPNYAEAEIVRRTLEDSSIRATLAFTVDGPRVMVWPSDEAIARATLNRRPA